MVNRKINVTLLLFLAISILFATSNAQNSPQDYLDAHNSVRRIMGVPDLTWDTKLEAYARNYANTRLRECTLVHSGGPYGENLALGYGSPSLTGVDAVNMWVNEWPYYDYQSNSCTGGQQCGHYTQIIWQNTQRVGCYRARCTGQWTDWVYVICSYDPQGNIIGEWPYNSFIKI